TPRPSFRSWNRRGRYTSACPSFEFRRLPLMYAEQKGDEIKDNLIRGEEENRGQCHHHEHHDGGDCRLAAGRPGDLGGLRAHFLQEFERAESHRSSASPPGRIDVKRKTGRSRLAQALSAQPSSQEGGAGKQRARLFGVSMPRRISTLFSGP